MKVEQSLVTNGNLEKKAQELIIQCATEVMRLEDQITDIRESLKEVKNDYKAEGLSIKALSGSIKRLRKIQEGKSMEDELTEEDLYLETLKESVI